ncbi:MAG: outer membrane protein transport protein [Myxococcota bacterium]
MLPLHRFLALLAGSLSWGPAHAAGLDDPYVGGIFGSPAATNPTATWWNPAGLAAARGTRFLLDVGPSFSNLTIDRSGLARGGSETFTDTAAVPFVGLASDFGVRRVGVGFALFVPQAQRWQSNADEGPNRYALRSTDLRVLQVSLGGAYQFRKVLSIGVSASILDSRQRWTYDEPLVEELAADVPAGTFDDGQITDPAYAATTRLELEDQAATFGVGLHLRPWGDPRLAVAVAYNHGARFDNDGLLSLDVACPSPSDPVGRAIAQDQGLCDSTVEGLGTVRLRLPARVHAGVEVRPVRAVRLEAFGTWVRWSELSEVRIGTTVTPDAIDSEQADVVASRLTRERPQARDLVDSFSATLDAKIALSDEFTMGVRVGWESAAVPTAALSAANADTSTVRIAGMGLFRPFQALEVGIAYGRDLARAREVTESAFARSIEPDRAPRYRYVESRGRYSFVAQRVGLVVKGTLGPRGAR